MSNMNRIDVSWFTGDISVFIFDFSYIEQLTSALLGRLITLEKKSKARGKRIKLVGLGPELIEILATTKLDLTQATSLLL